MLADCEPSTFLDLYDQKYTVTYITEISCLHKLIVYYSVLLFCFFKYAFQRCCTIWQNLVDCLEGFPHITKQYSFQKLGTSMLS